MRHEQTIVYQKCLALMETAQQAIEQFPSGFAFLADQLRRNTSSVAHNFAEGYYQDSRRQQRRFFGYAIQSAREASTSFDTAGAFRAARGQTVEVGKALALELVRMISKFDGGRGRQVSETGFRQEAPGSKAQTAGDRLQVIRPVDEGCEP
jgi:four helix bundle protein